MDDGLKKVNLGDRLRIPASAYNAFVDAALDGRALNLAGGRPHWRHSDLITVRNQSGDDQDQFAVMGIDGPIFNPSDELQLPEFQDYVGLDVTIPTVSDHWGLFVILAEPIPDGEIGAATITGATVVKIFIGAGEDWVKFADVFEGETGYLMPSTTDPYGSAQILWKEPGEGVKWAVVRLSNSEMPVT